jgi:hypothetical protein
MSRSCTVPFRAVYIENMPSFRRGEISADLVWGKCDQESFKKGVNLKYKEKDKKENSS